MTSGWKLDRVQRAELLLRFPPRYSCPVADHVTLAANVGEKEETPSPVRMARIVGKADDGLGVEALVVEIDGSLDRPDGLTWHVTWSLAEERKAQESNDVIRDCGFVPVQPVALMLEPAIW